MKLDETGHLVVLEQAAFARQQWADLRLAVNSGLEQMFWQASICVVVPIVPIFDSVQGRSLFRLEVSCRRRFGGPTGAVPRGKVARCSGAPMPGNILEQKAPKVPGIWPHTHSGQREPLSSECPGAPASQRANLRRWRPQGATRLPQHFAAPIIAIDHWARIHRPT